jgi:hypothetical protein
VKMGITPSLGSDPASVLDAMTRPPMASPHCELRRRTRLWSHPMAKPSKMRRRESGIAVDQYAASTPHEQRFHMATGSHKFLFQDMECAGLVTRCGIDSFDYI